MKEQIPVNPEILKWARVSLGLPQEEVARKIHKSVEDIQDWEAGKSAPTYTQLEYVAYHIYKRPVAVFFFPELPVEDTPIADFRTLPEAVVSGLPSEIIKMYRKAKVFQINIAELHENLQPVDNSIIQKYELSFSSNVQDLVWDIRGVLGVDIGTQTSWSNLDNAFEEWRRRLNNNGIFVFKDAFRSDDYSGFCLYDKLFPVIYVNNTLPKSRQIFTLFHELAHLLFKSGGIDVQAKSFFRKLTGEYSKLEVKCNEFAGETLLPSEALHNEQLNVNEVNITDLALKYKVSRELVLRKFLNLNLIDETIYREWADKWINEAKKKHETQSSGGNYYYTQKAYLGDTYINLAFGKYFQNKITVDNLADYLGMKVKYIPTFESYALG